ncbi:MAG TPA: hypothetical protein VH081_02900 [Solirubrobacteraceae bacterium]|jgi:hypothetical protein|nr:hypothetical protein [Solirubrobacteraceae bacterium]
MTHISRPFQIALAVLVLFVAVWFLALRGHSSSGSGSEPAAAVSAPASASSSSTAAASSATAAKGASGNGSKLAHKAHHAAVTGQPSLKHTIDKAQGAVKKHSPHKAQSATAAKASTKVVAKAKTTAAPKAAKSHAVAPTKANSASANTQQAVEAQLKQGKVVAVLFWSPLGTVDRVVRRELQAVSHSSHGRVAVHVAGADEIGAFGSFTRAVQVFSTPTILLINAKGKTSSVSGLTDTFGIKQAVREVKQAK